MRTVCVYCGSANDVADGHRDAAFRLGTRLAEAGLALVFGGGRVGLMGICADAALRSGGKVVGVIPGFLEAIEVGHKNATRLEVTASMHERKARMAELADAFVILPGGLGTLDELFEILTWKQLGLHDKPIVLVDVEAYWRPLRKLLAHLIEGGYARPASAALLEIVDDVEHVLPALARLPAGRQVLEPERL